MVELRSRVAVASDRIGTASRHRRPAPLGSGVFGASGRRSNKSAITLAGVDIEVALLVRDTTYLTVSDQFQGLAGPDANWKIRPKTTVRAKPRTTLNTVIAKAARELGVEVKPSDYFPAGTKVSDLYMHEYVFHGDLPGLQVAPLILLNADGSAQWYFDPDEVTFADVQAVHDADAFLAKTGSIRRG